MPLISIIIPVYNAEKYLTQCIQSIQQQTLSDIEIICIDDGSSDNSLTILEDLQKKDHRIKILTQSNKFAGVARNAGLAIATGDYIMFSDADDFVEPDYFEIMYHHATSSDADICICNADMYDVQNSNYKEWSICTPLNMPKNNIFSFRQLKSNIFTFAIATPVAKIIKRSFIEHNSLQFQDTRSANDVYFTMISYGCANSICYIPSKPLYHYRTGLTTNLQSTKNLSPDDDFKALNLIYQKMKQLNFYKIKPQYYNRSFANYTLMVFTYLLTKFKDFPEAKTNTWNYFFDNYYSLISKEKKYLTEENYYIFSLIEQIHSGDNSIKDNIFSLCNQKSKHYFELLDHCIKGSGLSYVLYSKRAKTEIYYHIRYKLGTLRKKIF